jgi:hypothetical protein
MGTVDMLAWANGHRYVRFRDKTSKSSVSYLVCDGKSTGDDSFALCFDDFRCPHWSTRLTFRNSSIRDAFASAFADAVAAEADTLDVERAHLKEAIAVLESDPEFDIRDLPGIAEGARPSAGLVNILITALPDERKMEAYAWWPDAEMWFGWSEPPPRDRELARAAAENLDELKRLLPVKRPGLVRIRVAAIPRGVNLLRLCALSRDGYGELRGAGGCGFVTLLEIAAGAGRAECFSFLMNFCEIPIDGGGDAASSRWW